MIEGLMKAVEVNALKELKNWTNSLEFKLPDLSKFVSDKENVNDAVLANRIEAAAHSSNKFFNLPDVRVEAGESIAVAENSAVSMTDDVFKYNLEQFKKMGCTSFEDMSKVWAHECGHRLLQNYSLGSWGGELGADFFAGVRSEMLGLPKSNFEKFLGSTKASDSHPDGKLRMQAMDYGRSVVAQLKKEGKVPTLENCLEAYGQSRFAKINLQDSVKDGKVSSFIDNRTYHTDQAARAKEKFDYNMREYKRAMEKGDFSTAKDYSRSADRCQSTIKDEMRSANRCSK